MKNLFTVLFMIVSFLTCYPQDTIYIPNDYSTIQEGIAAASNGDIVLVEDGTYIENINYRGKAIIIASWFLRDGDTTHVNNTIIDGSQPVYADTGSVVTFNSGEDTNSVLCGFTITGGTGTYSAPGPPPYNYPSKLGGGIFCDQSGPTIKNNHIIINNCFLNEAGSITAGGGICAGPIGSDAFIIIENNKIMNNNIWSQGSSTSAWAQGGGIALVIDGRIQNNEIVFNECKSNNGNSVGGGIVVVSGATVNIIDNNVSNNTSISANSHGFAGGISIGGANALIKSNNITNNSVSAGSSYSCGAAMYFDLDNDTYYAIVENNFIADNTSLNSNGYGGAIGMWTSSPKITNNIITRNSANYGGALNPFNNSKPILINNTIALNNANNAGGAIYSEDPTTNPIVINTIMWNNVATISGNEIDFNNGGSVTIRYCDITGGWSGEGNIDIDPSFRTGDDSLHLSENSPCIDVGIDSIEINSIWLNAPLVDIDKESRPNGEGFDMGSDEFYPPVTVNRDDAIVLSHFKLYQNYPNPFNPKTSIIFGLPEASEVKLTLFNSLGEKVANLFEGYKNAGYHQVEFDASELPSGVYFYQLRATPNGGQSGNFIETKKMVLMK